MVAALKKEISLRKDYLGDHPVDTIYFGGGTPSLLNEQELKAILETVSSYHSVSDSAELTLEANPDDLTREKLSQLKRVGINRLSIGVQSFHEVDLKWMNRSHNASQAKASITTAQDLGFDDLSVDLIFGCPTTTDEMWEENLNIAAEMRIQHLSCYGLTIEEKTALSHQVKSNKGQLPKEESNAHQFEMTMTQLKKHGYEQYEISNYARDKAYSKHNTNYWKQVPYLGIGPSAHSFDGTSRQWNISNNPKYLEEILTGQLSQTAEELTKKDRYNEYVMTSLRTIWGCDTKDISENHPDFLAHYQNESKTLLNKKMVQLNDGVLRLTQEGKLLADQVTAQLFAA